jgi:adenine-specific DNA-methyltransferase
MSDLVSLLRRLDLSDSRQALWEACGLLPSVGAREGESWIATSQHERLKKLTATKFDWSVGPHLPDDLFAPTVVAELGAFSCLTRGAASQSSPASTLWMQLLPLWLMDRADSSGAGPGTSWHEVDIGGHRAYSLSTPLNAIAARSIERHKGIAASRSALFARSANYMGSKAALASQLLDIVDATEVSGTTMVDLMCGSGVMASAFARRFTTIASDAQEFCRLLGLVQGGGMTHSRGEEIAQRVIQGARRRFNDLSDGVLRCIEDESQLVNSELAVGAPEAFLHRLRERLTLWESETLGSLEAVAAAHQSGRLFGHLYGGLFFGDRQAAELDCLRQAIAALTNETERSWALGALVCAASACAYTYGGHFAQPKLDISDSGKARGDISEALKQRSLSVTHEFFTRLTSLATESERVEHSVSLIEGPWEAAIPAIARAAGHDPVCVYIDPPYTRDEYSRYYHVLEALVRYEPQAVSGKGRLPRRGSEGRFASKFSGRRADLMEAEIARAIQAVLANGWNCLWSYSNTGIASIEGTLARLGGHACTADVFCMDHSYKAQGKRGPKRVIEYAVHLRPT